MSRFVTSVQMMRARPSGVDHVCRSPEVWSVWEWLRKYNLSSEGWVNMSKATWYLSSRASRQDIFYFSRARLKRKMYILVVFEPDPDYSTSPTRGYVVPREEYHRRMSKDLKSNADNRIDFELFIWGGGWSKYQVDIDGDNGTLHHFPHPVQDIVWYNHCI